MRACPVVLALLVAGMASAAEVLTIDGFEYPDAAAARQAWVAAEGSDPADLYPHAAADGKTALKLPCPFDRDLHNSRTVYDRTVQLNLVRYGAIAFDFYVDDPAPVNRGTIYFHTPGGWYGAGFATDKGWHRIVIGKGAFGEEDKPVGWDKVDTIRICAWRGRRQNTFCAVDNLQASSEDIVLVSTGGAGPEAKTSRDTAERIGQWLAGVGVPHGIVLDSDVAAGALEGRRIAVFAYSPNMSDAVAEAAKQFVARGGKLVAFYTSRADLAALLGVGQAKYKPRAVDGEFADVVFEAGALPGLPAAMRQGSWNITGFVPVGEDTRVVGYWRDKAGKRGGPAVVVNPNGAYMGHILTADDEPAKQAFVLALLGHLAPSVWKAAADNALSGATRIGPFTDQAALESYLKLKVAAAVSGEQIQAQLATAARAQEQARASLREQRYPEVIAHAQATRAALADAYALAHRARDGEFRAVWNHSGTGDCGTWEQAMQHLAAAHFNAVVPNMWWGGVAHYDSKLLPHSKTFTDKGDQIAQCVAAGRKYGIEVHPWKVNWNLSNAPKEFVARMRAEGRLQANSKGEELAWLCPSHPDNLKLEVDTMLEVVRNYDVDGVHFDYIRYPHGDSCYCAGCRKRFEASSGKPVANWPGDCTRGARTDEYRDWRCRQISNVVQATSEQAHKLKPSIKISAAVFSSYPACRRDVGQDWVLWCKQGWLDFVCPMDYTESDNAFVNLVSAQVGYVGGAVPVYSGIGVWRITTDQAIGQMELSRAAGADGCILFNMGTELAEQALPQFGRAITATPALLPHSAPVIRFRTALDNDAPVVEAPGEALEVEVTTVATGAQRRPVTAVSGTVELQDMDGKALAGLGPMPPVGESAKLKVAKRPGRWRLAVVGELKFAEGAPQRFIVRSRPYHFGG